MAGETMPNKSIRRSLSMTPEMAERLKQITTGRPRNTTKLISSVTQTYITPLILTG